MNSKRLISLLVVILLQLWVFVLPAAAISVSSVTPDTVNNSVQNLLTISGTDFVEGAALYLNGTISLTTTYVDSSTLTAVLPQGFQAGVYSVTVVNPDSGSAVLPGALTVLDDISTSTPTPTSTPTGISTEETPVPPYARPVVVVTAYATDPSPVDAGGRFTLTLTVKNQGQVAANNLLLSFTPGDFMPVDTGGVLVIGELAPGKSKQVSQAFAASASLWGMTLAPLEVKIGYTDAANQAYAEVFTMSLALAPVTYSAVTQTPTPTPTVQVSRPRLLVVSSQPDLEVLQPGSQFNLLLQIKNVGSEAARIVNMVVGGAALSEVAGTDTPGSGSYSASGGDFQNFSPLGSSNVQALGDITVGSVFTASQALIVNVSTNPGAYPLKISFVYQNAKGETLVDDQVITLLVQSPPMVDISFYRSPGDFFTYQPNALPIQVVNIGRKSIILGNLKVTASNGTLENSSMQIGYLDPGGYLTLDAMLIPDAPGVVNITVQVDFIDDFNQPQQISRDLEVFVVEAPPMEFPEEMDPGAPVMEPAQETFWQVLWRIIKGLIGLDSSPRQEIQEYPPMEGIPEMRPDAAPVPVPVKGP